MIRYLYYTAHSISYTMSNISYKIPRSRWPSGCWSRCSLHCSTLVFTQHRVSIMCFLFLADRPILAPCTFPFPSFRWLLGPIMAPSWLHENFRIHRTEQIVASRNYHGSKLVAQRQHKPSETYEFGLHKPTMVSTSTHILCCKISVTKNGQKD